MRITIIFLVNTILTCFKVDSVSYGNFVSVKELPFLVSLTFSGSTICGGAIISEFYVITAAHCIDDYEFCNLDKINMGRSISIGSSGSQYDIKKIYVHGEHVYIERNDIHEDYIEYDIALIELKIPIQFNEYQHPIKLSSKPPKGGDNVTICGFGSMGVNKGDSPSLRKSEITVIDHEECNHYSDIVNVPNSLFCAGDGSTDVCSGDSGNPAIINGVIVGIVASGPDCDYYPLHDHSPGLYARVDLCYDWILNVTGIRY